MWLVKSLGSIWFTIWSSVGLMVLLIVSTSLEGLYGTAFAQTTFYQARWFDMLLSLLWINIFCATLIRFPFRRRQVGFLITHLGILGLLLGALLTRLWGIEGKLLVGEGERSAQLRLDGYELAVTLPDGEKTKVELRRGVSELDLDIPGTQANLRVLENAVETDEIVESKNADVANLAAQVIVRSPEMKIKESFWLVEDHPWNPATNSRQLGPLLVQLQRGTPPTAPAEPLLQLRDSAGEPLLSLPVDADMISQAQVIGDTGWTLQNLQFYPFARVEDGGLKDVPESGANPAVEFDLVSIKEESQHVILFAHFPNFASMHGRSNVALPFSAEFTAPDPVAASGVQIFTNERGEWNYQFERDGVPQTVPLVIDEWIELGKMDLQLKVKTAYERAEVKTLITDAPGGEKGVFMAKLDITEGDQHFEQWLSSGQKVGYHAAPGDVIFKLQPREHALPFVLTLTDFRKTDYPGTTNAASYESDVVVFDPDTGEKIQQTISMNNPFDYRGYRIFQSSFMQDPRKGEASIFTVAKNPGITFIYISCTIIFLGAFIQFYIKPALRRQSGTEGVKYAHS